MRIRAIALCILGAVIYVHAQSAPNGLKDATHSASLTFFLKDGTCIYGTISKADADTIVVNRTPQGPIPLQKSSLLQVSQGNALLFSARSSWLDVSDAPVNSQETFVLQLRDGKRVKGRPSKVTPDSITLKQAFSRQTYLKSAVATVTYLRVKPESDNFDYLSQEAPYLLFFDPEFYSRAMRLEGRIPVLLYDSSKPEDDSRLQCPHK